MSLPPRFPPALQRYQDIRFCPRCGHAYGAEDFRAEDLLFLCPCCSFDFYQNPLPAAVAVIPAPRDPGRVLMIRRRTPPGLGLWCVPGGFIRYGEMPAHAACREALEETGWRVKVGAVLRAGLVDYSYRARQICVVEIAFLAHLPSDTGQPHAATEEASAQAFVALEHLFATPSLLAFPEQFDVLAAYAARVGYADPPSAK